MREKEKGIGEREREREVYRKKEWIENEACEWKRENEENIRRKNYASQTRDSNPLFGD